MKYTRVDLEKDIYREVAEHEVFLSFYDEDGAYAFHIWWEKEGSELFAQFCQSDDEFKELVRHDS